MDLHTDLESELRDRVVVSEGVGPADDVVLVSRPRLGKHDERLAVEGVRSFQTAVDLVVHHVVAPGLVLRAEIGRHQRMPSWVQPMPDGRWLFVDDGAPGSRSMRAVVRDERGYAIEEFELGHGVNDAQVDAAGVVWVAYEDRGVLDRRPLDARRLGLAALAAWSAEGEVLDAVQSEPGLMGTIEIYALNVVSNREVWVDTYTGHELVELRDREPVRAWASPAQRPIGIAVDRERVATLGQYDDAWILRVGRTTASDELRPLQELRLDPPDAADHWFVGARGSRIYRVEDERLMVFDLASLR